MLRDIMGAFRSGRNKPVSSVFLAPGSCGPGRGQQISEQIGEAGALLYNVPRSRSPQAIVTSDRWRIHPRCST